MKDFLGGILGAALFILGLCALSYIAVLFWCGIFLMGGKIPL